MSSRTGSSLTRGSVLLMAIACGLTVANLYYNQPMLDDIRRDFGLSASQVGLIPMLTQLGYAFGLLTLTPLGDRVDRRRLILGMLAVLTLSLIGAALSPSLAALGAASFLAGVTSTVAQQIVPLAAQLAEPARRGKTVGQVMSGLLIGILAARTLSGVVATAFGWRDMFWIAAAMMVVLALILARRLPHAPPTTDMSYRQLMVSLLHLARRHPALREASLVGGLLFASFSVFWSTLTLWLASPAFGLGADVAGMFGLVGVVGALAAPVSGRLADHGGPRRVLGVGIAIVVASFVTFGWFGASLWGLAAGVILLDLGVQGCQIANQTRIYALDHAAASRLNTVYMTSYFVLGALGSALGSLAWSHFGWLGVSAAGLLLGLGAGLCHWAGRRHVVTATS
ncbi:MFS transporter [Pandoraea thiooxydans]|uniref:Major facilitator superfamily (MFS) profile domain-containing protein n=1 Tax=Pandoraea thiooxydans TaxID=445709 RepID=A0A0G3EP15_9BURK|nr:MFS transporter [Pandoraea thiooxydans]AKJ68823.1 MFS transporter [Pandoraea thiooxydans]